MSVMAMPGNLGHHEGCPYEAVVCWAVILRGWCVKTHPTRPLARWRSLLNRASAQFQRIELIHRDRVIVRDRDRSFAIERCECVGRSPRAVLK